MIAIEKNHNLVHKNSKRRNYLYVTVEISKGVIFSHSGECDSEWIVRGVSLLNYQCHAKHAGIFHVINAKCISGYHNRIVSRKKGIKIRSTFQG